MSIRTAIIGFGEAGQAFAGDPRWRSVASVFDILTDDDARRPAKLLAYAAARVAGCDTLEAALAGATLVVSLVTADQAPRAAAAAALTLPAGAFYCDMNSVAPATKYAAATAITAAGGRYVDIAIMAPVHPQRLDVPLLASGPEAIAAAAALAAVGFTGVRVVGDEVGAASSIKMIRSVVVKGREALTAECLLAAHRAGVVDEVLASLGKDWAASADYDLERMMVHGRRRAAEMEEVVATLDALGVTPLMTRAAAERQHAIGRHGLGNVVGLGVKLAALAAAA